VTTRTARCAECAAVLTIRVEVAPDPDLHRRLARIERALGIIHTQEEQHMSELDDRLAEIAADEGAEHTQLARLIQDFEDAPGAGLSDAQRQVLDQIKSHVVGDTAAITDADPEPAPPADSGTAEEPAPAE
jgi:microcystin degradation protein MlrC